MPARAPKPVRQVFLAVKSEDGRSLVQTKRVRGSVLEWRGSYGFVKPEGKIHHPEASKGRIYLHGSDLREPNEEPTVGAQVDFQVYADPKGLGAMDCRVLTEADQEEEEPLPMGWTEVWSEEHSEWYYWKSATKESSWIRPGSKQEEAEEELPDGWEKAFDDERGMPYFWHRPTKTASWERPGKEEEVSKTRPAKPQPAAEEASMDDEVLAKQRLTGRIVLWTGHSGWLKPHVGADHPLLKTDQDKVYLSWRDLQPGLAPEVDMLVDFALAVDDSGLRAVDVSTEEKKVEAQKRPWRKKPRRETADPLAILQQEWAKQDAELGEAQDDEEEAPAEAKEEAADENAAEGPLLPGWEEQWSEEHQCPYYWHRKTAQSSWERPSIPGVGSEVKAENQAEEASEREAPTKEATPMTPLVTTSGRSMTPITPTEQARTPSAVSKGRAAEAARILRMQGKPVGPTPYRPVRPVAVVARPPQPAGRLQVLRQYQPVQPRPTFLPAAKRPRM